MWEFIKRLFSSKPKPLPITDTPSILPKVNPMPLEFSGPATLASSKDYSDLAKILDIDVNLISAVAKVETSCSPFLPDNRPNILFESHQFHILTEGAYDGHTAPDGSIISTNTWIRNYGAEGTHQYDRLQAAIKLDRNAALQAASWGSFQIMGFNYGICGFANVEAFVAAQCFSEVEHLKAFANFIKSTGAITKLKAKDWVGFAKSYNGPGYANNYYDTKIRNEYNQLSGIK